MSTVQTSTQKDFSLTYEFNAPKQLVFNAFSTAEALNEWWGPAESKNSAISLDFRPGGIFHFKMEFGEQVSYGRFIFDKIEPYDLLEFTNAFADEQANVVEAPFDIPLPREIAYRLVFSEENGKTRIVITGKPVNGTTEEVAGFHSIREDMQRGFAAQFDQLAIYLRKTGSRQ